MLPVWVPIPLLVLCAVSFAATCKVNPTEYAYRGDYVTVSEGSAVQCPADNTRPIYVRCTGETLRLSDGDLGPDCAITGQEGRFYVWERLVDSGNNPIKPRLLLTFEGNISPSLIKLHYFSDPSNGRGLPTLNVYPNIDNPWDTLTTNRIATISALLKDVSEPPHRETISVNTMGQLHTVLVQISFPTGSNLSSFYLSEIEVFTCPQGEDIPENYNCTCQPGYSRGNCENTIVQGGASTSLYSSVFASSTLKMSSPVIRKSDSSLPKSSRRLKASSTVTPGARTPSDRSGSSSVLPVAAAAGTVAAVAILLIISGFVAVAVYFKRKKKRKSRKVIQHIGEDESNIYALVDKRKKKNPAPEIHVQDFDPEEEGLDDMETFPHATLSDPSTGQNSNFPPVYVNKESFEQDPLDSIVSQKCPPPSRLLINPQVSPYETPTPQVPTYVVPTSQSVASGDSDGNAYEDTLPAANQRKPRVAPPPASMASGKDTIAMDTDMYASIND